MRILSHTHDGFGFLDCTNFIFYPLSLKLQITEGLLHFYIFKKKIIKKH